MAKACENITNEFALFCIALMRSEYDALGTFGRIWAIDELIVKCSAINSNAESNCVFKELSNQLSLLNLGKTISSCDFELD